MMDAGSLQDRVQFKRRTPREDGAGNVHHDFTPLFTIWGRIRLQFGRESLEAGRLESTTIGTLTVRRSASTESLTADDIAIAVAGQFAGQTYNIRSIVPSLDGTFIEMTIESQVAV